MSPRRRPGPAAPARLRRAGTFAATSAVLACSAHGFGGGGLPSVWLLLLGAIATGAAVLPLLGREATWPRITAALAAAHAGLHGWLALTAAHHGHGAGGTTARMLTAHVVATVVAVVWLRYFEHRVWSAARQAWVRVVLHRRRWLPLPALHPAPAVCGPVWLVPNLFSQSPAAARGVRGPPVPVGP